MKKFCLNNRNNECLLQNNKHKNDTEHHRLFIQSVQLYLWLGVAEYFLRSSH